MKLIVAVDIEWGIGLDNDLLFKIPEDLKYFKNKTLGNIIVMGRKTKESLPGGKGLSNRLNVVLSRQEVIASENLVVCKSLKHLFNYLKDKEKEIYVIGGAEIYNQLLDYCSVALVTKVNAKVPKDKYFPNLDKLSNWELVDEMPENKYKQLVYKFTCYKNNKVLDYNE